MRVNPKLMNSLKELRMQQTQLSKAIYLILKAYLINRYLNNKRARISYPPSIGGLNKLQCMMRKFRE